jgi:hypothetical protein
MSIMKAIYPVGSQTHDEIYTHSEYGTYNVALMRRAMDAGLLRYTAVQFPINETWVRTINESDINPETLAKITIFDVGRYPCLFMWTGPNEAIILDGLHRLAFAVRSGIVDMRGHYVKKKDAEPYKIHYVFDNKEVHPEKILEMGWGKYPKIKKRR